MKKRVFLTGATGVMGSAGLWRPLVRGVHALAMALRRAGRAQPIPCSGMEQDAPAARQPEGYALRHSNARGLQIEVK